MNDAEMQEGTRNHTEEERRANVGEVRCSGMVW